MRICFFARADYILFQRRATVIARNGHDVHVLSLQQSEIDGCHVHQLPSGNRLTRQLKVQHLLALPGAQQMLNDIAPDIIDIHGVSSYGIYSLLRHEAPLVTTIYGPDVYDQAKRFLPLQKVAQTAVRRADMVTGSTPSIADYVEEILKLDIREKLQTRSWGIPVSDITQEAAERRSNVRRELGVPESTRVIFHSRQLAPLWRIPLIIEAAPDIVSQHPDTEFWFAFPPPNLTGRKLLTQYQERAAQLGIADKIRWLGFFPYDDLISVMHAADVHVCVGVDDLLASTLLEGMATGQVPVLADLPAYHEVIRHGVNGFFLPDATADHLADTINRVLRDFDTMQPVIAAHNQKLIAEQYDEVLNTLWLLEQYQSLLNHPQNQTVGSIGPVRVEG